MNQKFTSTIAGASIFISLVGLLSRGFGFLREMLFASYFGLESDFDIYLVSAVFPITINTVFLYVGQNFFVPAFQKVKPEQSQRYYNQAFGLFIAAGFIIFIILFFLSNIIIDFYVTTSVNNIRENALLIFKLLLLTIPFSAGISMLSALLQTFFEFKYPSLSVLILNVSIIILILLFTSKIGIYVIPAGYLVGTVIQFFYLLYKSKKYFKIKFGLITSLQKYDIFDSFIGRSVLFIILIELIGQFYSLFDRYFYGDIMQGGIASLNYAYIVYILPITIFSVALSTVIFPKITKSLNESSISETIRIYNDSISINVFLFMPVTFMFLFFGDTLIKIAFERGKFLAESTTITYNVLQCYSVSLVFYSAYSVLNKLFFSLNIAKILLIITIIGMIVKLVFNFLLVGSYQQYGLALSTSFSYLFFFAVSYIIISRKLKILDKSFFMKEFGIYFINGTVSLIIVLLLNHLFPVNSLLTDVISIALFFAIYFMNLYILKHKSTGMIIQIFNRLQLSGLNRTE